MATTPPEMVLTPQKGDPASFTESKIFLGGLGPEVNEDDLISYFSQYGSLADVVVMRDKVTRNGRGFGFVTFQDRNAAERVVTERHDIKGKQVEAKIAVPRPGEVGYGGGQFEVDARLRNGKAG
eukprot:CAMPEP_0173106690 /NCGR_PEP_ID=MMETSP1102-20130122/41229_1 /TAXON_ID=49646 /ORGANISM="Geminigera sp., Strain Caron Lab Isolate" /LENGTH=123 /DNA_ID=CAMNT_0014003931 /DNA_START=13 /DNA_END=380 /DNA_ORIENTATION=-